jgi:hypothetical protein
MNTAVIGTAGIVRPSGGDTLLRRISRRSGIALLAWSRSAEQRHAAPTREELAELHERRLVAAQLREERFRAVALGRLL